MTTLSVVLFAGTSLSAASARGSDPEPSLTASTTPDAAQLYGFIERKQDDAAGTTGTTGAEEKKANLAKKLLAYGPDQWINTEDLTVPLAKRATKSKKPGPGLVEIRVDAFVLACMAGDPCDPNRPAAVVVTPATPALRISDLATFTPDAPTQQMQPNGWMVKGLSTNFVARAAVHEQTGELLGQPADVRFTPISYSWDYGDGTTGTSTNGGATWQWLNLPEFSETDTSHTYESTGEYTITPSVTYRAEYRYAGSDWLPVDGTISITGPPNTATAWIVRTALVAQNCIDDPQGIGCHTDRDPTPNQ
ncbi:hypothetical protein E3T55_06320 [Cryobacterium frigoriphilum]|uniref:PKD domain-containing protein n=1 Tax=Cryobacterium frigoriphilum TaxID=1259150 RepID=A0A4R9A525_9MICO|nr:hypothetical protein [Cryobacterium frigoriphilum]TFD52222.1 hypothetical protein E3T55_06320 [Cryobacterium frigoriphilum]